MFYCCVAIQYYNNHTISYFIEQILHPPYSATSSRRDGHSFKTKWHQIQFFGKLSPHKNLFTRQAICVPMHGYQALNHLKSSSAKGGRKIDICEEIHWPHQLFLTSFGTTWKNESQGFLILHLTLLKA